MNIPQQILDAATHIALRDGVRVLQGCRLAETDEDHVKVLLDHMEPPAGARILDIGCGFGEVSRLMALWRPDLKFILLNMNELQLRHAGECFPGTMADMHALPFHNEAFDGVMFCYSLCHSDFHRALAEASRVTRVGGEIFVYDYDRIGGDNDLMQARLFARALPFLEMAAIAAECGWYPTYYDAVIGDDAPFRRAYANDAEYDAIFDDLAPTVWKMVRQ